MKSHLGEWMGEIRRERELDLVERSARVEVVEQRFIDLQARVGTKFEAIEKRFEAVDDKFESMQRYMDRRFSSLQWIMGLGFTLLAALIAVFNFFYIRIEMII